MNNRSKRGAGRLLVLAILALLLATPAAAQEKSEDQADVVEKLSAEGLTAFQAGRYKEALQRFKRAYRLYKAPNLLFNIARSYQGVGDVKLAIEYFRRFLSQPNINPKTKADAEVKLKNLEEVKERGKKPPSGTEMTQPQWSQTREKRSIWQSPYLFWSTLGAGVALAAGGSALLAIGIADDNTVRNAPLRKSGVKDMTQVEASDLVESAKSKKTAGMVLLSVGGVALAASAVLLLVGRSPRKEKSAVSDVTVGVSSLPGGGAAMVCGRF